MADVLVSAWPRQSSQMPTTPGDSGFILTTDTPQTPPRTKGRLKVCLACGKKFQTPAHLSRHMLVHTGEKPFGCRYCGRGLTQKSHLHNHMRKCKLNPMNMETIKNN